MFDLDPSRATPTVSDAATLVVVRSVPAGDGDGGIEVFCVERKKGGFLGGALVFPGGRLDRGDLDPGWAARSTPPRAASRGFADDENLLRGLAVAACREALEEAALLPVDGPRPSHTDLVAWRERLTARSVTFEALIADRALRIDLGALHPLTHWITPVSESRRFDTRFFLWPCGEGWTGQHDGHEVTSSLWATPAELLRRFDEGSVQLAPPTHRTLAMLATAGSVADAIDLADASCLDPILPKLVAQGDAVALVLPGDPEHDVREARCPGPSRFVLRGGRFFPAERPA